MLKALDNTTGYISREKYYNKLKKIENYEGVFRTIKMNKKNFNQNTQLLKYLHGQIVPLN